MTRRWALSAGVAALCGILGGCIESTRASLPPTVSPREWDVPEWEYAGSFGGTAAVSRASSDPWERRYEEGKFLELSGLAASHDEVWACDTGISRIQVFDLAGRLLRTIGAGVPINGTLPDDLEMFREEQEFVTNSTRWEDTPEGQRWVNDTTSLFKGYDVALRPDGYWLSDQAYSAGATLRLRPMACRFYRNDGAKSEIQTDVGPVWPGYVAADGSCTATSEMFGNVVCLSRMNDNGIWIVGRPPGGPESHTDYRNVMLARSRLGENRNGMFALELASSAGSGAGQFSYIGGLALYNGKLIVCDRGNRRLQVFEARPSDQSRWTVPIKVITALKYNGKQRFRSPLAIAVSPDGYMYVLDGELREVAVLSPTFERLATLKDAHLEAPCDIALSADGRTLFVSDQGPNLVHRYVVR